MNNKKRVLSALEKLWYGIPLRKALEENKADLSLYFRVKRTKTIYIPAFDKNLSRDDYTLLVSLNKDLVLLSNRLELIDYV